MFGFGKPSKDPLADPRSVEKWLAAFPADDPFVLHAEIVAELGRAADRTAEKSPHRLEAVFHLDELTEPLYRNLVNQYIEHSSRSGKIENRLWQALFDLTQSFLVCFAAFAREIGDRNRSSRWQALQPGLIARQLRHLGIDAEVRLFRFEPWIPAKWMELHELFSFACTQQIERIPVTLHRDGDPTTIERQYLEVLALQLLNTGNLTPRQIAAIADQLDEWCSPLRLTLDAPRMPSFYVDLASRSGLARRGPMALEGRVLYLDTRPLHALLREQLVHIEHKIRQDPLSERTSRRSEQLALYEKLAAQVDPEFRPMVRRGERIPTSGQVDAIIGFRQIVGFLHEEERVPVPQFEAGRSYGGTMDLALFGHTRNEGEHRQELVRRRLAEFAPPGGAWNARDVSQSGYRLEAPMSVATTMTLGSLCALRPTGQSTWQLGVVRRMRRITAERAEIGLQTIANTIIAVTLADQHATSDGAPGIVDADAPGRLFDALFLALRKKDAAASVQSLIIPVGEYQPTRRFALRVPKATGPIHFGSILEHGSEWIWVTIEPIDLGAASPKPGESATG